MPTKTSTATGDYSAGGTWVGGIAPVAGDDVVIANTHNVKLNTTGLVCKSLTINSGGTLSASTTADSDLTVGDVTGDLFNIAASTGATINIDLSGASAYKCTIILNKGLVTSGATSLGSGTTVPGIHCAGTAAITLKGAPRTRMTRLNGAITAGATSATLDDISGWAVGDRIVFGTTQPYAATAYTVTSSTYSSPYLTCNVASNAGLVKGSQVLLSSMQTNLNRVWDVYDLPGGGTSFRINVDSLITGFALTDGIGTATLQPKADIVTIATLPGGNQITWTDGTGTAGGVPHDHADNGYVGNFSSNVTIRPFSDAAKAWVAANATTLVNIRDVAFNDLAAGAFGFQAFCINTAGGASHVLSNNAFFSRRPDAGNAVFLRFLLSPGVTREDNVIYTTGLATGGQASGGYVGNWERLGVFATSIYGINLIHPGEQAIDCMASGCGTAGGVVSSFGIKYVNCSFFANLSGLLSTTGASLQELENCDLGTEFGAYNSRMFQWDSSSQVQATDCVFQTSGTLLGNLVNAAFPTVCGVKMINKDLSVTAQEEYYAHCEIKRVNATDLYRATSSLKIRPVRLATDCQREISIPCANGASVRVIGWVKKSHATNVVATVAITGLGSAVTPFTKASDTNWEQYSLSATNSSGADGNFTVTFTANSSSGITNDVWFDGVPDSPFITKARHFGFTFDQTIPNVIENDAVTADQTSVATLATSESTALALVSKVTVPVGGATVSPIVLAADATFQEVYDYTQAWACATANLGYAIPCTSPLAGTLLAAANVTTTGFKISGAGSLAMGGKVLTASLPFDYTYTGGTFSQATTIPTFSGGTLNIGAAGTFTYAQAAAMILSMTPTAPGTYALGATTFTGQVDLRNTAAHAITVELPTGTSYTTASNTGGTITVSLPVVTADISITSMPNVGAVPTRLQIINKTALSASAWAANTVYATGALVKRSTGIGSESTAGLYFRATTGGTSHATTEPTWDTTVGNTTADNTVVWTCYAVLYYDTDPAATSLTDTYIDGEEFLAGETVGITFAEMDAGTSFKRYDTTTIVSSAGFTFVVAEEADDVYATNALDGSAYETTFSPNFTTDYIVLDTNTDFAGKAAYAYFCYTLTTSAGMYNFWGGVTALDEGNYRVETDILNLYFDESGGFVKQTDDVRIFRKDGLRPAIDPTTGGFGIEINWRTPVSVVTTGGSALTPTESAYLLALPAAADTATAVWSKTLPL